MYSNWYVYRHRRLDTSEIFYVGISGVIGDSRANTKHSRNNFWKNIVAKSEYIVEILFERLSHEDACELEIFLISEYGRRDLGKGSLCNLTDGGEGSTGYTKTQEWCDKHAKHLQVKYKGEGNPFYGKAHAEDTKLYIGDAQKEYYCYLKGSWDNVTKKKYNDSTSNRKSRKVINIHNGLIFNSLREASEYYSIKYPTLKGRMLVNKMYSGNLWYLDIYESMNTVSTDIISFLEKSKVLPGNIL